MLLAQCETAKTMAPPPTPPAWRHSSSKSDEAVRKARIVLQSAGNHPGHPGCQNAANAAKAGQQNAAASAAANAQQANQTTEAWEQQAANDAQEAQSTRTQLEQAILTSAAANSVQAAEGNHS